MILNRVTIVVWWTLFLIIVGSNALNAGEGSNGEQKSYRKKLEEINGEIMDIEKNIEEVEGKISGISKGIKELWGNEEAYKAARVKLRPLFNERWDLRKMHATKRAERLKIRKMIHNFSIKPPQVDPAKEYFEEHCKAFEKAVLGREIEGTLQDIVLRYKDFVEKYPKHRLTAVAYKWICVVLGQRYNMLGEKRKNKELILSYATEGIKHFNSLVPEAIVSQMPSIEPGLRFPPLFDWDIEFLLSEYGSEQPGPENILQARTNVMRSYLQIGKREIELFQEARESVGWPKLDEEEFAKRLREKTVFISEYSISGQVASVYAYERYFERDEDKAPMEEQLSDLRLYSEAVLYSTQLRLRYYLAREGTSLSNRLSVAKLLFLFGDRVGLDYIRHSLMTQDVAQEAVNVVVELLQSKTALREGLDSLALELVALSESEGMQAEAKAKINDSLNAYYGNSRHSPEE